MTDAFHIAISRSQLDQAAELARACSTDLVRERVLISRAVRLALAEAIEESGIPTSEGRSSDVKYVDLLDVCDFTALGWTIEVRAQTQTEEPALYVPTMPLIVGVISDFYVCANVSTRLNEADVIGYATRDDLGSAVLSKNGLFALLPYEDLHAFPELFDRLKEEKRADPERDRLYGDWRERAERIMQALFGLLESERAFGSGEVAYIAGRVRDDVLRAYGNRLPRTGLERLFDQLFRRFGIEPPVPAPPSSPVAFETPTREQARVDSERIAHRFFTDDLPVRDRASLYRHLLEDDGALDEHRRAERVLNEATGGKHRSTPHRRAHVTNVRRTAPRPEVEPPLRTDVEAIEAEHAGSVRSQEESGFRMAKLEDLTANTTVRGILPDRLVTVVATNWFGSEALELTYKDPTGRVANVLLYRHDEPRLEVVEQGRPWSFDGDGSLFRLVSEAHRIRLAHLFDPVLAVHTSIVDPLPHQITAVYESMLPRQPLRFLLADDPGAGKTIMAGLLIKELIVRGDLQRCMVVCPGSLAEQWQDELYRRFNLPFEILTNDKLEAARTGNWFLENNLIIARLDKLSRNEDVQQKLMVPDCRWDLVVCDEAHKMSASVFGREIKYTKRYRLGQLLGSVTRHLLLMTATPHNGKDDDFQLFMALLDSDRFEGSHRDGAHTADVSDLMRRMVKEKLLKFDGSPLFPERLAYTVPYKLSDSEARLYKEVTEYVREEFNRAEKLQNDKRAGTVGFALTILQRRLASSPEAIFQSLRRRRERLDKRMRELELLQRAAIAEAMTTSIPILDLEDLEDLDEAPDNEVEAAEEQILDQATAARTIEELKAEIATLQRLEALASSVRRSGDDRKWSELAKLLSDIFTPSPAKDDVESEEPGSNEDSRKPAPSPQQKLVVFTEHRDTLNYLEQRITTLLGRKESVVIIHGGVGREDRLKAQEAFRHDPQVQVLVATDAAGEGINLQRAHLMVNYDLPWNPNRIEQRFGRIHRIGQTEVCHLWNLVAQETREGDVYHTLLDKLEEARKALGGQVFDVLGKVQFEGKPLRDLLIEAIRYGERPDVRARLDRAIADAVDRKQLEELLEERALAHDAMDVSRVRRVREDMERADARRLQPHYIESFFLEAFRHLGGTARQREPRRYEISHVPAPVRNRDRLIGIREPVLPRYERIAFEKALVAVQGQPLAAFVCPGHPLLDATLDLTLERHRDLLRRGSVLVDERDSGIEPRVMFYLEHTIQDASVTQSGERRVISKRMLYVELDSAGNTRHLNYAPYLDYRPLESSEPSVDAILALSDCSWINRTLEHAAQTHAISHVVPEHLQEVRGRRLEWIEKTRAAVKDRLTKEISYWDHRSEDLKLQEQAGKPNARLNSQEARRRADELQGRLEKRMEQLSLESQMSALPPVVLGGLVVVPIGLIRKMKGGAGAAVSPDIDRLAVAARARAVVMEVERSLGFDPVDREFERLGYDIESRVPGTGKLRFIEVKGRMSGAATLTVTRNEILYSLNKPDDFILAIVEFASDGRETVRYIRQPFRREPDFHVTSINYDYSDLWSLSAEPG